MTNDDLKSKLMIPKLGHRLTIIRTVSQLARSDRDKENVMARYHRYCANDSQFSDVESSYHEELAYSAPER